MQGYLKELADALLEVQDANGMWHQLLHLPFDKSYPESSGTALICYNLAKAYREGFLADEKYRAAALQAFEGLKHFVTEDGVVLAACEGPGPLQSIDNYLGKEAQPDDPHGSPAVLFACSGKILLEQGAGEG
jgi:rhamnogalacturonyl hydrolase YesR